MSIYVCVMYICILYMFVPCHVFNLHWNAAKIFIVRTNYAMLCPLYTLKHYICLQNILRHVNYLNGVLSLQNLASLHLFFFWIPVAVTGFPVRKHRFPVGKTGFPIFEFEVPSRPVSGGFHGEPAGFPFPDSGGKALPDGNVNPATRSPSAHEWW